ncbi:hypothetical protein DVH24_038226 [Malus domestica]|uniref:Mediator complex subunit 15 KIX domain-containing protein n=1 Tax=Malus domestica TaxID=3750 RepID=A0A498KEI9_MALDO|nr:hypothetical protein DVH24_038226 [Malus domestica]
MAMAASIRCMLRKTGNINEKSIQDINRTFGSIAATNVDATSSDNKDHNNVQAQADVLFNSLPCEPTTGTVSELVTALALEPIVYSEKGGNAFSNLYSRRKRGMDVNRLMNGLVSDHVTAELALTTDSLYLEKGCPKCCTLKWEEVDRKKKGLPILFAAARWKAGRCHRCGAATHATAAARRRNKGKKDVTLEEFISFATYYAEKYCQTYADPADDARAVKQEVRWAVHGALFSLKLLSPVLLFLAVLLGSLDLMDTNKWRPYQVGEAAMDAGDWRSQLQADSRLRIVNKIMDTLKRHLPFSGQDGLQELSKIAVRFEEKIYTAATSQSDYLRKISLKMLTMETKYQNSMGNPLQSNSAGNSNRPPDPGSSGMQPQVPNQGQSHSMPLPANQSQGRQPLLAQNIQNNVTGLHQQQQSNLSNIHQQQLDLHNNVTGLQQQQHLGTQSGNSSMQPNQHSVHLLQQSKIQVQQQRHQNASNMLPTQGQQSQPQASQQQMMSQIQSQSAPMQQMGLQQQSNPLQRDMQLQASGLISGTMLQAQNIMDQQKQLYQSPRPLSETSLSTIFALMHFPDFMHLHS